ncbi:MAG: restriction endonuclease subunit S [Candidatus Cloacimonetes bacterium]|nr:restriction endonuclease subunit S [Candidatus Cloacimonadota bacterium]
MEKNTQIPSLRFKGFTDTWEQCELGDLTDLYVGSSFTQELSSEGKYIVMDMGSVSQDGYRIELKRTDIKRDVLIKNDLVMPKDDIGGGLIIGKTAHIPTENTHLLGDHVFRLRFNTEDGLFMHYLINSNNVNASLKKKVTGSAQLGIRGVNVKNEIVSIPCVKEQWQIGNLFNNIDSLITLHQRKYERLVNIKKALLDKMFPKDGEVIPKLRFKGFADTWEQCKFSEVMDTVTDFVAAGSFADMAENVVYESLPDYAQLVRTTDLKSNFLNNNFVYVSKKAFEFLWRVNLDREAIIMPNIGNCGEIYYVNKEILPYKHNVLGPNAILVRSEKHNNKFLAVSFLSDDFQRRLKLIVSPNGQTKFNKTDLKTIDIFTPSTNEQVKVGTLFDSLDSLITLHQRKYEKLKNIKKALLKKMFV